jgi:hypothetical protein
MADRHDSRTVAALAVALLAGLAATPQPAGAEVVARTANGFQLKSSVWVSGTAETAYQRAVTEVARWWDPAHTYSGSSANLTLEARAGGCFCERLDGGGSVQHLEVAYVQPGAALRLLGGLGPLQALGASGALSWKFETVERRTRLTWTYKVTGLESVEVQATAEPVDQVLSAQLARLGRFIDSGAP